MAIGSSGGADKANVIRDVSNVLGTQKSPKLEAGSKAMALALGGTLDGSTYGEGSKLGIGIDQMIGGEPNKINQVLQNA